MYLAAVAVGLSAIGLVVAVGACGYAIAHATGDRRLLAGMLAGFLVVFGAAAAVVGSAAYTRLNTFAVVTVPDQSTVGVSQSAVPQPAEDAWLHVAVDRGPLTGPGMDGVWTIKESNFTTRGTKRDIQAFASGRGDMLNLEFRAPSNGELRAGMFDGAERAPFVTGKSPGLEIDFDGHGCNTLIGRFQIKTLTWTVAKTVAEMDVLFVQYCEGAPPAMRGELWFTSEIGVHRTPPSATSGVAF